ncbi:hypothetical protein AERO8C_20207 [Aeromonas veronii]|uniref:Uncharacterized protein n=1 Tax=Aeromonas veronii TaxID=654 RepID=A0A653L1Y6_AERVE|nr:hypothetical protein AERO8C_20207 [Aeromonas veronii]
MTTHLKFCRHSVATFMFSINNDTLLL